MLMIVGPFLTLEQKQGAQRKPGCFSRLPHPSTRCSRTTEAVGKGYLLLDSGLPDGSVVKNLLAVQGTKVQSLGREDPLEKEMAIHASILAWRIPWTEEPGGLQSTRSQRVRYNLATRQQQQSI